MKRISMMSLAAALVVTQVCAGPLEAAKWIRANAVTRPETDLSGVKWIRPVPTVKKLFSSVPNRSMATFFKISEAPTNAVAELCFAAQGKFAVSLFREGGEVELYRNGGDFENARELHYMDIAPWLAAGDNAIDVTREDDGEKDPRFLMKLSLPDGRFIVSEDGWAHAEVVGDAADPAACRERLNVRRELVSPAFARDFAVGEGLAHAELAITGLGFYEASVNGARVGDRVLDPTPTQYDRHVFYSVYDVTAMLKPSATNGIRVLLGHGWFDVRSHAVWNFDLAPWRDAPCLIAALKLDYSDGRSETVVSDASWRQVKSPVGYDDLREGEIVGGGVPGAPDPEALGLFAEETEGPRGALVEAKHPGARVVREIAPREIFPAGDAWVVDFGEDIAGWVRMEVAGQASNDVVVIQYDERREGAEGTGNRLVDMHFRYPAGYAVDNTRKPGFARDKLICRGGRDVYEPRFTYNGFRYVRLEGLVEAPLSIVARVVQTDFRDIGTFACSSDDFNALMKMGDRAYKANFADGIPTDCPHREKNGWTGDAAIASLLAQYRYENSAAYKAWLISLCDAMRDDGTMPGICLTSGWGYGWCSGPTWDCALWEIPRNLLVYRGDEEGARLVYPTLKKYVETTAGRLSGGEKAGLADFGLGDWNPWKQKTTRELLTTVYYLDACRAAELFARRFGKADDAKDFAARAEKCRADLRRHFRKNGGVWDTGSQCAQAVALEFGLVEPDERKAAEAKLVEAVERAGGHLDVGIIGLKHVFRALSKAGRTDLAFAMLKQETAPSPITWLRRGGTALWENWGDGMSRNHIMYGDFIAWAYQYLAGIRIEDGELVIAPEPVAALNWVKASVGGFGPAKASVAVEWRRIGATVNLKVRLNKGAKATVRLPNGKVRTLVGTGKWAQFAW